jgi:hypothetical protein
MERTNLPIFIGSPSVVDTIGFESLNLVKAKAADAWF